MNLKRRGHDEEKWAGSGPSLQVNLREEPIDFASVIKILPLGSPRSSTKECPIKTHLEYLFNQFLTYIKSSTSNYMSQILCIIWSS